MNNVQLFWCHEAQNIRCVRESDYAKLAAEAQALRDERDSQQRVAIKAMEELAALRARVVVVPERLTNGDSISRMLREIGCDGDVSYHHAREIWNACIDEQARLNGLTVSEGLLRSACFGDEQEAAKALNVLRALLSEQDKRNRQGTLDSCYSGGANETETIA